MVRHTARPAPTPSNSVSRCRRWKMPNRPAARSGLKPAPLSCTSHATQPVPRSAGTVRTAMLGAGWCWLNLRALPSTCASNSCNRAGSACRVGRSAATLHCAASAVGSAARAFAAAAANATGCRRNGARPTRDNANSPSSISAMRRADCSMVPMNSCASCSGGLCTTSAGRSPSTSRTSLPYDVMWRSGARRSCETTRKNSSCAAAMSATCRWLAASAARN